MNIDVPPNMPRIRRHDRHPICQINRFVDVMRHLLGGIKAAKQSPCRDKGEQKHRRRKQAFEPVRHTNVPLQLGHVALAHDDEILLAGIGRCGEVIVDVTGEIDLVLDDAELHEIVLRGSEIGFHRAQSLVVTTLVRRQMCNDLFVGKNREMSYTSIFKDTKNSYCSTNATASGRGRGKIPRSGVIASSTGTYFYRRVSIVAKIELFAVKEDLLVRAGFLARRGRIGK